MAEICLGRTQVVPVGLRLHAEPFHGDELALDAEQPLDDALRLLVASLTEVVVADDAVRVDEIERRPVMVGERAPDLVVVVERDRVVDRSLLRRLPHAVNVVLERELRRVDSDDDQPVVPVRLRPRTDVRLLAQPVDARQRPEVHEDDAAAQLGGAEWLGVEPPGRPADRGHVQTFGHGHLAKRLEPGAARGLAPCAAPSVAVRARNAVNAASISSRTSSATQWPVPRMTTLCTSSATTFIAFPTSSP